MKFPFVVMAEWSLCCDLWVFICLLRCFVLFSSSRFFVIIIFCFSLFVIVRVCLVFVSGFLRSYFHRSFALYTVIFYFSSSLPLSLFFLFICLLHHNVTSFFIYFLLFCFLSSCYTLRLTHLPRCLFPDLMLILVYSLYLRTLNSLTFSPRTKARRVQRSVYMNNLRVYNFN